MGSISAAAEHLLNIFYGWRLNCLQCICIIYKIISLLSYFEILFVTFIFFITQASWVVMALITQHPWDINILIIATLFSINKFSFQTVHFLISIFNSLFFSQASQVSAGQYCNQWRFIQDAIGSVTAPKLKKYTSIGIIW